MFSSANRLSLFGIILSALNIAVSLLLLFFFQDAHLGFALEFCAIVFLLTTSAILLMISCGLRGATQDMTLNDETYITKLNDLRKRVEALENRPH